MGTSTPFTGGKNGNPLIPTWLETGAETNPAEGPGAPPADAPEADSGEADAAQTPTSDQPVPTVQLRSGRTQFNKHARGGGNTPDASRLHRAIGSYVARGAGGSSSAANRMSSSGGAASALGRLLLDASRDGIRETVRKLNLDSLASRSVREIYASLVDFVCGEGGDHDEAINRDAYIEAVDDLMQVEGIDLERPSIDTINLLIESFISGTINNRILNAIGNKLVLLPDNVEQVRSIETEVRGFIAGAVRNGMAQAGRIFARDQIKATIDRIYERALAILETYSDPDAQEAR
ncbi:Qat anti-phage system associated protein QatB [Mesorhizobium sp. M0185]|uniref:Qat anti-phage system associated protein QatB n=1 Tax=Mesorhizobium sp. M0185 TaxID=2956907 RepID=UPI003337BA5D